MLGDGAWSSRRSTNIKPKVVTTDEKLNSFEDITSYNNFYEFGTGKDDPQRYAGSLKTSPVDGEDRRPVRQAGRLSARGSDQAARSSRSAIYRLRCVEAWSMVIPWVGIPLEQQSSSAPSRTAKATFVEFTTLLRPVGDARPDAAGSLDWPYIEGLRMDEAMHPLTILAVGLYGKTLMNQNGAPLRLVVPWKYGFKSIKSIVRIRFVDKQPRTAWSIANPERVRLLLERESRGRSSALEPGAREAAAGVLRVATRR